jgi:hypothetical protein
MNFLKKWFKRNDKTQSKVLFSDGKEEFVVEKIIIDGPIQPAKMGVFKMDGKVVDKF